MSNLSYRTRGNSNPQGKERVYFTCHPANFKTYFESICADIFETQNCAIWYREEMEPESAGTAMKDTAESMEELELDLGQMQLFVIPITSHFLNQPNYAREVEFQFAIDHHIPVLPIMKESGLEKQFSDICGELQFLDPQSNSEDLTAIPYEDYWFVMKARMTG